MSIQNLNLCFVAFPQDFILYPNSTHNNEGSEMIIKTFPFPSDQMSNSSLALIQCEKFCGRSTSCWGCSLSDNNSSRWDAITDKKGIKRSISNTGGVLKQKPGTNCNRYCIDFTLCIKPENFFTKIIDHYLYFSLY